MESYEVCHRVGSAYPPPSMAKKKVPNDEQYSEMYAKFIFFFSFDEVYNFEKKKVVSEDFKRKKCIKQIENSFSNIFSDFFSNLLKRMDIRV